MKNYHQLLIALTLFLVSMASLTSCGDDTSSSPDRDDALVGDWSRAENDSLWGLMIRSDGNFTLFTVDSSSTDHRYVRELGSWETQDENILISLNRCEWSTDGKEWNDTDDKCGKMTSQYLLQDSLLTLYTGEETLYFVKGRTGILPDSLISEGKSSTSETNKSSGKETSSSSAITSSSSATEARNCVYTVTDNTLACPEQSYRTTVIGDQTWMAENLNYTVDSSWCYNNEQDSCAKYGRLYQWTSAMEISTTYNSTTWGGSDVNHQGICPDGWHIPNNDEWQTLYNYVDTNNSDVSVGSALKSASGWNEGSNGSDIFSFSGLPAGAAFSNSNFVLASVSTRFWSTTEIAGDQADAWGLYEDGSFYIESSNGNKLYGFSVRCIKDSE